MKLPGLDEVDTGEAAAASAGAAYAGRGPPCVGWMKPKPRSSLQEWMLPSKRTDIR